MRRWCVAVSCGTFFTGKRKGKPGIPMKKLVGCLVALAATVVVGLGVNFQEAEVHAADMPEASTVVLVQQDPAWD